MRRATGWSLAVAFTLAAGVLALPARSQSAGKPTEWKPDPARLEGLDPEAKFSGWAIRPPRGYRHRVTPDRKETRYLWAKEGEGALIVSLAKGRPAPGMTAERAVKAQIDLLKTRMRDLTPGPVEHGRINGRRFARMRFTAEGLPSVAGRGAGFVYTTLEGGAPMALTGIGTVETIEVMDTAALTFRSLR